MPGPHTPPSADSLMQLSADAVIEVLDLHWFNLSPSERDAYTHVLLEHPDRVVIFDGIFRRARNFETASKKARN